ncbi:MAG: exo-alpha-sialidase [Opitutus sp.]|nr:exo-alpha-sialidase [Opitutus sp.]
MKRSALFFAALAWLMPLAARATPTAELLAVHKIWDEGAHNAFTDLIRWENRWWCTFRESEAHVGGDGAIRILSSADGAKWEVAARLTETGIDLRDPKLTVMPAGKLMLNCGGSVYEGRTLKGKQSRVLFSSDGRTWSAPQRILREGEWLWRVTWHDGVAYGAAYESTAASSAPAGPEWYLSIYQSRDGVAWTRVKKMEVLGRPNETTLRFEPSGEMLALVRREGDDRLGNIGRSRPPYQAWTWQTSNHRFGGQNAVRLPGGTWIVGTRDYRGAKPSSTAGSRTILAQLESDGRLTPLVTFPSDGDTSYPGLVWHDGVMWVSYYSSHEGKSAIYVAQVKINER